MVLWLAGGWFARSMMVEECAGIVGTSRVLKMRGWDHIRPVGMQKTGNEVGRREVRGVGIGMGGR